LQFRLNTVTADQACVRRICGSHQHAGLTKGNLHEVTAHIGRMTINIMETRQPSATCSGSVLASLLFAKVDEQLNKLEEMVRRLPAGLSDWTPPLPVETFPKPRCLGEILGHLLQCLAGFLAVLYATHPDDLKHFLELKNRRVNHCCGQGETLERIAEYRRHIGEGFDLLTDEELCAVIPTVFVPQGEAVFTLLLGNLEHLINHKHELFYYAKLAGVPLTSPDLYQFRNEIRTSRRSN
jgi:hypothetical protein